MMNPRFILYLVAFSAFMGPLTQTIYTPILPEVRTIFQTTPFLVNLSISIFTIFLALMQIVYGPLVDRRGRRVVLVPAMCLYLLVTVGASFASSIGWLLVFRALQAVGIAAASVVATTVIGDLFQGRERGRAMGTFQMMVSLGPVVGPMIGGWIGGAFGVHGIFYVLTVVGLFMLLMIVRFLPETKPEVSSGDAFSFRDFSFVLSQRIGAAVLALGFVQYYSFYNFLVFLPEVLTERYQLGAEEKGLVFLPLSLMIVIGSFLGGRFQERFDRRKFLITSSSLNVLALLLFTLLAESGLPVLMVCISLFGLMLGLSLPVQTTLLTEAFVGKRATAIGMYNFFRYLGMAAGPLLGTPLFNTGGLTLLYGFATAFFAAVVWFAGMLLLKWKKGPIEGANQR
ncbi:MAG: MFS transporter [Tumebacillaceae bacterium]